MDAKRERQIFAALLSQALPADIAETTAAAHKCSLALEHCTAAPSKYLLQGYLRLQTGCAQSAPSWNAAYATHGRYPKELHIAAHSFHLARTLLVVLLVGTVLQVVASRQQDSVDSGVRLEQVWGVASSSLVAISVGPAEPVAESLR